MEYITVREAAEKWRISERLVQKYCAEGRVKGADKFGRSWKIPKNAVKPEKTPKQFDATAKNLKESSFVILSDLMPLMNASFKPGECKIYIENMEDGPRKEIALAEYYYFTGKSEKAVKIAELYLDSTDLALKLSACLICAYANLTIGRIHKARYCLAEVKKIFTTTGQDVPEIFRAGEAFIAFAAAVLLHLPLPEELPPIREFLSDRKSVV